MKDEAARTAIQSILQAFMRPVSVWVWWKDSTSLFRETDRSRTDRNGFNKEVRCYFTLKNRIIVLEVELVLYRLGSMYWIESFLFHYNLQTALKTVTYGEMEIFSWKKPRYLHGSQTEQFKIIFQFKTVSSITSSPTNTLNHHIHQISDP